MCDRPVICLSASAVRTEPANKFFVNNPSEVLNGTRCFYPGEDRSNFGFVLTTQLPRAKVAVAYSCSFIAQVVAGTYGTPTMTLQTGTLPTGLTLNGAAMTITGTPGGGTAGTYPLGLKCTDDNGNLGTNTNFDLIVDA